MTTTGQSRTTLAGLLIVITAAATAPIVLLPQPGAAVTTCAKWASTDGDDGAAGTQAAPYRSLNRLVSSLAAGQTGCLPAGQTYYAIQGNGIIGNGSGSSFAPVFVTSGPGGTATVKGQLWFQESSHDVTMRNLRFAGNYLPTGAPNGTKGTHLIVHGDRIALTDNDISDGRGICIGVGKGHGSSTDGNVLAQDVVISRNVIHGCGMDQDIVWAAGDSGAHGVYLEHTQDAVVTHNLIYGNRYRGLQLWPRNDGAEVAWNTFDENATHVNIGSSSACGGNCRLRAAGFESVNTDVHHNIFSNRVTTWAPSQNPSQVYGYFLATTEPSQYGNRVHHNCYAPGDAAGTGYGYEQYDNTTASVSYVDRTNRDYHLASGSTCLGLGPSWLQPPGSSTVSIADASVVEGNGSQLGEMHFTLTRTGDTSQAVTGNVSWEDVTASTNGDYSYLPSGEPLFAAGQSTSTLIFEVMGDEVLEADETFLVHLADLSGAALDDGTATGTILDDDGATYRPDAMARRGTGGTWTGNDVYDDGSGQELTVKIPRGRSRTVQVRLQNDGTASDTWSVAEAGPGGRGVTRTWLMGTEDVTGLIDRGELSFHDVAPTKSRLIRLELRAARTAKVGRIATWQLHGVHNPLSDGVRDVVSIRVKVVRRVGG